MPMILSLLFYLCNGDYSDNDNDDDVTLLNE